jgi:ribonuclease BN (tRNA processing enzyme)
MAKLTFLGTSGSVVTSKRMCAGILLEDKLLDIGFGVLGNLIHRLEKDGDDRGLDAINEVYITHTHSDHIGDFTGLIWAMALQRRTKKLRVICSDSTAISLKKILELQSTPKSAGFMNFEIDFLKPENVSGVKHIVTIHDPENYAYRFDVNGSSSQFVYTGDTARFVDVAKFARGCNLLIHDATFVSGQESLASLTLHSTAHDAASIGRDARVTKLVLTHISPENEGADQQYVSQARSEFDGEIIVAKDNLVISL